MIEFKVGEKVRQKGHSQVMTVTGDAGLAASRGMVFISPGKLICKWTNNRGRTVSNGFLALDLEHVV